MVKRLIAKVNKKIRIRKEMILTQYYYHRLSILKLNGRIKIAFIVQMPEIWDKQRNIYETMRCDSRFDVWLIIVPRYNYETSSLGEYGYELEFFKNVCDNKKYICAYGDGEWINIRKNDFQYVFYQRPYNEYLPTKLRSNRVKKVSKICYVPYATPELRNTVIYPSDFFANIYFGFMEDASACQINNRRYPSIKRERFVDAGYPVFERCLRKEYSCDYRKVLWTPRWSYDPLVGGSHFFEYNNQLTTYEWGNAEFKIRPHPMMWENFLRTERMTRKEIETIEATWDELGIKIDDNEDIVDTFKDTDILISDRSSVIPMFFLTGKPVIYCEKKAEYGGLFNTILPGLYVVNSWDELDDALSMLLNKDDPLQTLRKKIIIENFSKHYSATNNIISCIVEDTIQ